MQAIINWLNSDQNYSKGLDLYLKHGTSDFYKKLLASRMDELNVRKLRDLLEAMAGYRTKEVRSAPATIPPPAIPVTIDKKQDNGRYLALIKKKGDIYTVLNMLKNQSRFLPDGEALRICAVEILNTNQKLMECWAQIDYFQDNGSFEIVAPAAVELPVAKQKQYLRQSISKCRKRLSGETCRDKVATQKLLDSLLKKLEILSPKKQKSICL